MSADQSQREKYSATGPDQSQLQKCNVTKQTMVFEWLNLDNFQHSIIEVYVLLNSSEKVQVFDHWGLFLPMAQIGQIQAIDH